MGHGLEQIGNLDNRRPLSIRRRQWVHKIARQLVQAGATPNQVSLTSIGFAVFGAFAFGISYLSTSYLRAFFLVSAAACIQLRLVCNLLDGIMAIEEGKKTPAGAIYNELPDRIADSLFLVLAGYAAGWGSLGWLSALLAVLTAYIRALGGALGIKQDFCGPMAKQHRMFALTAGSLLAIPFPVMLTVALAIIMVGTAVTAARRTHRLAIALSR